MLKFNFTYIKDAAKFWVLPKWIPNKFLTFGHILESKSDQSTAFHTEEWDPPEKELPGGCL